MTEEEVRRTAAALDTLAGSLQWLKDVVGTGISFNLTIGDICPNTVAYVEEQTKTPTPDVAAAREVVYAPVVIEPDPTPIAPTEPAPVQEAPPADDLAPQTVEEPAPAETPNPGTPEEDAPTVNDVQKALRRVVEVAGRESGMALLAKHLPSGKPVALPNLDARMFATVIADAEAELAKHGQTIHGES